MRYVPYGPFELSRDDKGLILMESGERREFWELVDQESPGLSSACGCYIFAIRAGRGTRPWYVGKAERRGFKKECLTGDKIEKYNSVLESRDRGIPLIYLYARITKERGNFSKPTKGIYRDTQYLEKLLIGRCLERNRDLINIRETLLLKNMIVPGLINNPPGQPTKITTELRLLLGLN